MTIFYELDRNDMKNKQPIHCMLIAEYQMKSNYFSNDIDRRLREKKKHNNLAAAAAATLTFTIRLMMMIVCSMGEWRV